METTQAAPKAVAEFNFEQWIMILCSQTGIDKRAVPAEVMDVLRGLGDKNQVNKMFFQWHEQFAAKNKVELTEEQLQAFKNVISYKTRPEYIRLKTNIDQNRNAITQFHDAIRSRLREMVSAAEKIREMEGTHNMDLWPFVQECLDDGWYTLDVDATMRDIGHPNYSKVWFNTPRINIQLFNKQAGISKNVDMGHYKVIWDIRGGHISVRPGEGAIMLENYCHPHVSSDESVCWGNASNTYATAMSEFKPKAAMQALRVILQTYNDASPYYGLQHWERVRTTDPKAGSARKFVQAERAWIASWNMPSSWASEHEVEAEVVEDGDGDGNDYTRYLMQLFKEVYEDGTAIPGTEELRYIRTRNGRNFAINVDDVEEWY